MRSCRQSHQCSVCGRLPLSSTLSAGGTSSSVLTEGPRVFSCCSSRQKLPCSAQTALQLRSSPTSVVPRPLVLLHTLTLPYKSCVPVTFHASIRLKAASTPIVLCLSAYWINRHHPEQLLHSATSFHPAIEAERDNTSYPTSHRHCSEAYSTALSTNHSHSYNSDSYQQQHSTAR